MKKIMSTLIAVCMLFSVLSGVVLFSSSAGAYETFNLKGFSAWTQAELNNTSGNNGYQHGCVTALYVETNAAYCVGGTTQAIKAVKGGSGSYNNCIVSYPKDGYSVCPVPSSNVWASADGSSVNASDYDGVRIAVLNSKGEPANFTKVTLRVTNGWNYSNNKMRYWEGKPTIDSDGWCYFPFDGFVAGSEAPGTDIYDYFNSHANSISMLCTGGSDEDTCYYSGVEYYRTAGQVNKNSLVAAIAKLTGYDATTYASQIAAAQAVVDNNSATQKEVDAQLLIINTCINEFINNKFKDYAYVQLKGVQEWTASDLASLNKYGSNYALSDKGLKGNAAQSVEMTVYGNLNRFCLASKTSDGFLAKNPFEFMDTTKGYKLSDFDGLAIAFSDADGNPFELSQFQVRLMPGLPGWDIYYDYEGNYYDVPLIYHDGYYHLYFKDYSKLSGDAVNDISIISALFYKNLSVGEKGYFSDICAFKEDGMPEEPEIEEEDISHARGILAEVVSAADDLGLLDTAYDYYDEVVYADSVRRDSEATLDQIRVQIAHMRNYVLDEVLDPGELYNLFIKCFNAWKYNYTAKSYQAFVEAVDQAWSLYYDDNDEDGAAALLATAYEGLVPQAVTTVTGSFFDGWDDTNVNAVMAANPGAVCESIGAGLNREPYNVGDFSGDTVFEAGNGAFKMTALADFDNKAMGWKNMDREGTLVGKSGASPAMNVEGISKADGIRFKLESTGKIGRILIGLSNCKDFVREDYAMFLRPEYIGADGYINIPFSYFVKAFWAGQKFSQKELEQVIVFIVECYDLEEDTEVTISDVRGYKKLAKVSESVLEKTQNAAAVLEAYDIDGRHAELIASAKALTADSYDAECNDIYDQIFALLKGYKDPAFAIVDVPGFSIYTQAELDMMDSLDGESSLTKTERGAIYNLPPKSGDYAFTNGIYVPDSGFEKGGTNAGDHLKDPFYGKILPINGKNFIDMLGGYKLTDIIAFRFQVENATPGKGNAIHYTNGAGLWHGLMSKKQDVTPDADNWFTYYMDQIPIDTNDWYYNDYDLQKTREECTFAAFELFDQRGKEIYNWQVILYEALDRSALKQALIDYKDLGVDSYDAAMEVYYSTTATEKDIADAVAALNMGAVAFELAEKWEYNYTAESWTAFRAAADAATTAAEAEAAIALLVPRKTVAVTGNLLEGWTTANVNAVVTANSDKLADFIKDGNADFTNNTTFEAADNLVLTAGAAFDADKAMGWKNMDRSGTLGAGAGYGYPVLKVAGLKDSEGLRFKLDVEGTVDHIVVGVSNCAYNGYREQYAYDLKAEYVGADGYINIPWSYFVKASWGKAFAQDGLEEVEVFLVEYYGATAGTKVTISDLHGYKELIPATDADFEALNAAVTALKTIDLDETKFADLYALAEGVANSNDHEVVAPVTEQLTAKLAEFGDVDRAEAKAKLNQLIALDVTDYFADDIASFKDRYYGELDAAGATQLVADILACIDQFSTPDAPEAPTASVVEPTKVVLVAIEGAEYKCGDGEWQKSPEFTGLAANTEYTFYARYAAVGVSSASESSLGTVVKTLKFDIAGTVTVTGDMRYGTVATAEIELSVAGDYNLVIEWYTTTGSKLGTGTTYTFAAEDIGATVLVKVSSDELNGELTSDAFGPIGKGLVTVTELPTADKLPLGMTLENCVLTGGVTNVEGTWAFADPDIIPEYEQSGSEFDVVFTPNEPDLYEAYTGKLAVEINAVTEAKAVVNTENGRVELSGDFHNTAVTTFEMTNVATANKTAYIELLRAANRSGSNKNIIFMYTIDFGTPIAPYIGTLTFKAEVGADRVGETYTVWFFTKDGVVGK
ncbi:MAG: hypothetical protein IKZ81_07340, partial [Clostridia bacterium]|nr:hypothetical protein [Clostridia bacterium]